MGVARKTGALSKVAHGARRSGDRHQAHLVVQVRG